ncbi:MAG: helix-turn-helix domain-containing protein [Candidatus Omnitrophica bacterium]|nr:helix-turn-helix domain-containing protein [Candidatus Omnitrophota bacterium]MDD5671832.1 helix-turn-helix domain-containing protein [Candidatus Omnitrophota bacterium]
MEQTNGQSNSKQPQRTQIMTPKEAAKYLGFHLVTIYRLLKKNIVPATKIGGQWRFKKDILDAWLSGRMNNKPTKDTPKAA